MLDLAGGVLILTVRPASPLSAVVECIWHYENDNDQATAAAHRREIVLPDGRFQITLSPADNRAVVSGVRSQHVLIEPGKISWIMGVAFHPGGAAGLLRASALEFVDRSIALELVWGSKANRLLERLRDAASPRKRVQVLEAALVHQLGAVERDCRAIDATVKYALHAFTTDPDLATVANVSRQTAWSRRWFTHMFAEQVGMTPKRYCRLMRFQRLVREIASCQRVDWTEVALTCGFSDQAHLIHEFRAFSGLTPERYVAAERPFPNHVRTS
jgi:AraC-like DNA-binding protein